MDIINFCFEPLNMSLVIRIERKRSFFPQMQTRMNQFGANTFEARRFIFGKFASKEKMLPSPTNNAGTNQ